MSYVAILDTQLDPDAPLTSQLAYQFRDNPEAIALGLSGATRISGNALNTYIGRVVLTVSGTFDILNLLPSTVISFMGSFANGSGDAAFMEMSVSTDNGSTWGAWSRVSASLVGVNQVSGVLNLSSGTLDSHYGTIAFDANINAIRFRHNVTLAGSGNSPGRISVYYIGLA